MPTIKRGDEVMELTPLLREDDLPLQRLFRWEAEFATRIYLTQPLGNGESRDYSWAQTLDEARRMAAHLRSFGWPRSEEHTSELQSLMRTSYAVFCLKKKTNKTRKKQVHQPATNTQPQ